MKSFTEMIKPPGSYKIQESNNFVSQMEKVTNKDMK